MQWPRATLSAGCVLRGAAAACVRRQARRLAVTALLGPLLLLAPEAAASQQPSYSLARLVALSDATVLGHALRARSYWQGTRIVTCVEVAIDELWSGTLAGANHIEVVTLGGVVGELGQRVDGAAELPEYGRMVLHLRQHGGEYTPTGMAAGVWHVDGLWGDDAPVRRQAAGPHGYGRREPLAGPHFARRQPACVRTLRAAVRAAAHSEGAAAR